MNTLPSIWLGSEPSFIDLAKKAEYYLANQDKFAAKEELIQKKLYAEDPDEEDMQLHEYVAQNMMSKHGNVGMISIDGPMLKSTDFFSAMFGYIGYDSISAALSMFAEDEEVSEILLLLDTPGGSASGVEEVGDMIKAIDSQKPVRAYGMGGVLSAGYWLASSTREIQASKMSELGSIGAIASFTSVAGMLEKAGIETYVSRGGKDKALLNPSEPISPEAKAMLDEKTATLHSMFIENVLRNRPSLSSKSQDSWATGKTFFTSEARAVGLVDGQPIALSDFFDRINQPYASRTMMNKSKPILLSESARAALQAGAQLSNLNDEGADASTGAEQAPAAALSSQETSTKAPTEASEKPAEKPAEQPQAELKAEVGDTLTAFLQASLKERDEKIESLAKDKFKLETKLESLTEVESQLRPIAVQACQRMQVALGQTQSSFDGFTTAALAGEYSSLQAAFNERYPAGRQSVSEQKSETTAEDPAVARLRLVQGS
jgi:signal peptide peptidase SppA